MINKSFKINMVIIIGSILLFLVLSYSEYMVRAIKPNNGNISVKSLEIKESSDGMSFDLKYPEVEYGDNIVKDKINGSLRAQVLEFKQYIEDIYKEFISSTPKELVDNSISSEFRGMSDFEYEIIDNILSIRLNLIQFTGGAHPMTYRSIGDNVQYYLTKDNIVIFYQLYELAPYSAGIPEFKIPYSVFGGNINVDPLK